MKIYFDFSASEIKGLLCLLCLLSLFQLIPYIYHQIVPDEPFSLESEVLFKEYEREKMKRNVITESKGYDRQLRFDFDPNTLSGAGWEKLGLSKKQAASILKYRENGGRFKRKEDLQKMYTIRPELYAQLLPHIRIAETQGREQSRKPYEGVPRAVKANPKLSLLFELNTADSADLIQLSGIGPVFASRIVRYRELLGGFNQMEQLLAVYGMDSLRLKQIWPQLSVNSQLLKKIPINTVTADELRRHPYIGYKLANVLIAYRNQHGNYLNFADLSKVAILNAVKLEMIAPYISYEHD